MAVLETLTLTNMLEFPIQSGITTQTSADEIVVTYASPVQYRVTFTGAFEFGPDPDDDFPDDFDPGLLPPGLGPGVLPPGFDPNDLLPDGLGDLPGDELSIFDEIRGTVTGVVFEKQGQVAFEITELNVPVGDDDNEAALLSLLSVYEIGFDGDDRITGSDLDDVLQGWSGNDTIDGGAGIDFISGMDGDDLIIAGSLGDTIYGNDGFDTVVIPGLDSEFRLSYADGALTLDNKVTGEPQTTLYAVETVIFDNGDGNPDTNIVIETAIFDGIAALQSEQIEALIEMYVAYFNRAPDAPGLFYWGDRFADGMSLEDIAASFFVQPETVARYPNPDDVEALVDEVYQNVLERAPDTAGRDYWIGQLEEGLVERGEFILNIINGAKNFNPDGATQAQIDQAAIDARVLADKADIGAYFAAIQGLSDVEDAATAMETYLPEDRDQSLRDAKAVIDQFVDAADSIDGGTSLTTPLNSLYLTDPFFAI
ncbi:MAG: DUF4214 domain-containing protein [Pseudomonadota bacterium]